MHQPPEALRRVHSLTQRVALRAGGRRHRTLAKRRLLGATAIGSRRAPGQRRLPWLGGCTVFFAGA